MAFTDDAGRPQDHSQTNVWTLGNNQVQFAIDKTRANVASGVNMADGNRYLGGSLDEYTLKETPLGGEAVSGEGDDRVVAVAVEKTADSDNPRILSIKCRNSVLGLDIIKTYELWNDDHKLIKKITFKRPAGSCFFCELIRKIFNRRPDSAVLLKYAGTVNLCPEISRGGYYHVRNERDSYAPFLTRVSDVSGRTPMDALRGMSQICFVNPQTRYGVGHYKYLVNNRFDLKYGLGTSYFTPAGWVIAATGDFIGNGKSLSVEMHYTFFPGDHVRFYQDYMRLPAYREANNYQAPGWLQDVRLVLGWHEVYAVGARIDPAALLNLFEKDEPVFGYVLSPWNDPMYEHYGDFLDGEIEAYPKEGVGRIEKLKIVQKACPRLKLSCYTWHYSIGHKSKIFLNHPEWLVYDENDKPRPLADLNINFPMGNSTFRQRVSDPDYVKYACERVNRLLTQLDYDTYYMDDISLTRVSADWRTKTAIHNYHWIDYWKQIRETVKSVGQDRVLLANSYLPDMVGADCWLIETGGPFIDPKDPKRSGRKRWTSIADRVFMCKLFQYDAGRWIAPVFWGHAAWAKVNGIRNNDPYYPNYLIGLGLKPMSCGEADAEFMGSAFNSLLSKLPYVDAAYETRGARIIDADVSPCWWIDNGNIEAYTLKQGGALMIPVISHETENAPVKISVSTEKAGLDKDAETYSWVFDMEDPRQFSREEMLSPDWRGKSIMRKRFVKKEEKLGDRLEVGITARPLLLSLVLVTQVPAMTCGVNGRNAQILLPGTLDVDISGRLDHDLKKLDLKITSRKDKAEVMAYFPGSWGAPRILSGANEISCLKKDEFGMTFYVFGVNKGTSNITLMQK